MQGPPLSETREAASFVVTLAAARTALVAANQLSACRYTP